MKYWQIPVVTLLLLGLSAVSYADQSAWDQLQQMTHTDEHTGVKFDGSKQSQPRSGVDVQVRTSTQTPSTSYTVNQSSNSYTVNSSSNTANSNNNNNNSSH